MAAKLLKQLREARGLSREQVPYAMAEAGIPLDQIPSVKSLWRYEELGHTPSVRIRFVLATFYGRDIHSIWPVREPRCANQ